MAHKVLDTAMAHGHSWAEATSSLNLPQAFVMEACSSWQKLILIFPWFAFPML
jgi:hypothetical protein